MQTDAKEESGKRRTQKLKEEIHKEWTTLHCTSRNEGKARTSILIKTIPNHTGTKIHLAGVEEEKWKFKEELKQGNNSVMIAFILYVCLEWGFWRNDRMMGV